MEHGKRAERSEQLMSLPHEKLIAIQKALNGNDQIENMPCFIAADLVNEYEILKNRPGTPKIAIGWASSKARSNFPGGDITGRENQYLYATISRGRGLSQHRADNLIYGVGGGDSLVALAYRVLGFLRAIRFDPKTDEQPDYVEMEHIDIKLYGVDGIRIKIWVGSQSPIYSPLQLNMEPI